MRQLFLLRHGKSAWPDGVPDHQRPLNSRGIVAIPMVGRRLAEIQPDFDLVLVSDARRTRETFERLCEAMPALQAQFRPEIYEARPAALLEVVQNLPASAHNVLMIGHNPGFHALGLYLANPVSGDGEALRRLERKLPTSGLIHLAFEGEWTGLDRADAALRHFVTPSQLGGVDED